MSNVFEEGKIAGITLKNRIIRSATHEGMADEKGRPTENLIKTYELLAKGGVGAIITGFVGIMQNGKSPSGSMVMIDTDDNIDSFKEIVNRVHTYDTPIILQIAHCGRQTRSKITGYQTVAPSAIRDKLYTEDKPHELTESEIWEIINNFVLGIERAKKSGFDGVQLHIAHGYLLSSFLSPHMNRRKDRWGDNTESRFRIVKEILLKARGRVGNYPILAKINGYEKSTEGIKTGEAIKVSQYLEEFGCNAIEVSCGIAEEGFVMSRGDFPFEIIAVDNFKMKKIPGILKPLFKLILKNQLASPQPYELYNLETAEKIRKQVNIPVIVVGGIRKLDDIKNIIENQKCEFVSMSRPFIIEPTIVNKFKEGKQTQSKCINCNYCLIGLEGRPLKCYYGKLGRNIDRG
jgi:2,4-dienoyl-CoA reductase-like NADH-dependent reductase (Old Yellow Enzyme family)